MNILEEWVAFEVYSGCNSGFYRLIENKCTFEIRVKFGSVGFKRDFEDGADPLLLRILDFCRKNGYVKVRQSASERTFFK